MIDTTTQIRRSDAGMRALAARGLARSGMVTGADLLCFGLPLLVAFEIKSVGRLYLVELALLALLPFLLARTGRVRLERAAIVVLTCGVLWLWAQVITDLVRVSAFGDYTRGWLKISFTLTTFIAFYLLIGDHRRRLALASCGLVIGWLLQIRVNPSRYYDTEPWKFGFALPVTLGIVLLACTALANRIPLVPPLLIGLAAVINLIAGFRSLSGMCFLASAYVLGQQHARRRRVVGRKPTFGRVLAVSVCAVLLTVAFLNIYGYAARSGMLGAEGAAKYQQQASGRFGIIFGGRPQIYASFLAIRDSPIVGHGSWAKDPRYSLDLLKKIIQAGYTATPDLVYTLTTSETIPTHSYLFGAWVEAGILGALFWAAVAVLAAQAALAAYTLRERFHPLFIFLTVYLLWSILFSPYGADQRVIAPFAIVALLLARRSALARAREEQPDTVAEAIAQHHVSPTPA